MPLNVLVVDNSAAMRSVVIKVLLMTGMDLGEIREAANGEEGLEILDKSWVDLVIVDGRTPVVEAQEMLKKLHGRPEAPDTPVLFISKSGTETCVQYFSRGETPFIRKPFAPETMREIIHEIAPPRRKQPV